MTRTYEDRIDALRLAFERRAHEDRKVTDLVLAARAAGASWQMIGEALGMSKQAAWERYGRTDQSLITMQFGCRHSLSVEVNRIVSVGSNVLCGQCGKHTKVVSHAPS
jgi:hypothetical protein